MSRSIIDLLGKMNVNPMGVNQPMPEGELYNPDVPNDIDTIAGNIANRKIIQDKYYSSMKLSSAPRNGEGYSFSRTGGRLKYYDPRQDSFMLDGSIDPDIIRRKTDPNHSLPNTFSSGSMYAKYQLPKSAFKSSNNVGLLQKSIASYENYINRFNPPVPN